MRNALVRVTSASPMLARYASPRLAAVAGLISAIDAIASYLVDPASSHMLVSKIKPCMSKYKPI